MITNAKILPSQEAQQSEKKPQENKKEIEDIIKQNVKQSSRAINKTLKGAKNFFSQKSSKKKSKSEASNVVQPPDAEIADDINDGDLSNDDSTELMHALCYGSVDDLDTLISNGLSIEQLETGTGCNALPVAACGNREAMVKRLIELGVDMFATNEEGQTALELAKLNNADGVVAILEQNMNFAIGCKDGQYEMVANILQSTPLHLCEKVSICDAKTIDRTLMLHVWFYNWFQVRNDGIRNALLNNHQSIIRLCCFDSSQSTDDLQSKLLESIRSENIDNLGAILKLPSLNIAEYVRSSVSLMWIANISCIV